MKIIHKSMIALILILLSTSIISAQDLSKYRNFSLGMRLAELSKQVNVSPDEVIVVHQSPALIQELTSWPLPPYQSTSPAEPVQEILFSFYNGSLYKITVTYEDSATEGLTAEDMTRAMSAKYGVATLPIAEANPTAISYGSPAEPVASWQDSQYSGDAFPFSIVENISARDAVEANERPSRGGDCRGGCPGSRGRSGKGSRAREERSRRCGSTTAKQLENVSTLIWIFSYD